MEALLLSDAIKRVYTVSELQDLINTQQVKSRLLELSNGNICNYKNNLSRSITRQFVNCITVHPCDRNLKLEFIDVINVLNPVSVTKEWYSKSTEFTKFLSEVYLNGDITIDWIVNLIKAGGSYRSEFFVKVMNDDNEQEVYDGLLSFVDKFTVSDEVIGKVGSRRIIEQYILTRGIRRISCLLTLALITSTSRFRLIFSVLLENGHSCKEILISHLSDSLVSRKTSGVYGTIISTLASDCSVNLVDLRDELPLGSHARYRLCTIINTGDV